VSAVEQTIGNVQVQTGKLQSQLGHNLVLLGSRSKRMDQLDAVWTASRVR
jgi:hypothetical protein